MKTVSDIYKHVSKNYGAKVFVDVNGTIYPILNRIYIKDDILYFLKSESDLTMTAWDLNLKLEFETSDECWLFREGIEMYSSFPDVEIMFCDKSDIDDEDGHYYQIDKIVIENLNVVMICKGE